MGCLQGRLAAGMDTGVAVEQMAKSGIEWRDFGRDGEEC